MDEADLDRLLDIVEHAQELAGHLHGATLQRFHEDKALRRVAERLLEICGEAANHLSDDARSAIDADWRGLRNLRIVLAHAYPRVEPAQLWTAATESLPHLALAVRTHLDHDR